MSTSSNFYCNSFLEHGDLCHFDFILADFFHRICWEFLFFVSAGSYILLPLFQVKFQTSDQVLLSVRQKLGMCVQPHVAQSAPLTKARMQQQV